MSKPDGDETKSMKDGRGPSSSQLDAALEGARDPVNFNTAHQDGPESARANAQRSGGGGSGPSTGSAQGGSNSTAGPMDAPTGPDQETGGPRGAGYPPSRTTGGRIDPDGDPRGVEPDEAIKRETAVFEPGTMRKPE
jgi:hypothetical protein